MTISTTGTSTQKESSAGVGVLLLKGKIHKSSVSPLMLLLVLIARTFDFSGPVASRGVTNNNSTDGKICHGDASSQSECFMSVNANATLACCQNLHIPNDTLSPPLKQRTKQPPKRHPKSAAIFRYIPNGLLEEEYQHQPIPFQEEWLHDFNVSPGALPPGVQEIPPPKSLPVPSFVHVFQLQSSSSSSSSYYNNNISLQELGHTARQYIDANLHKSGSGAMVFRNLHTRIQNASDFATFWKHVTTQVSSSCSNSWNVMDDHLSCYNRKRQRLYETVDRVDTDVPSITIGPHNEHSCNPHPSNRIFFYALNVAKYGGQTLLRRNRDIEVPQEAWDWVQHHGGLQFQRQYPSEHVLKQGHHYQHPTEMSWQERCHTTNQTLAQEYFAQRHGISNVTFEEDGAVLHAHNILQGYIKEYKSGPLWFNRIDYGFPVTMADGTVFPYELQAQLKRQKWHETYAFPLQPGDWLVLDNLRVQHGRLPYKDDATTTTGQPPRQLLVTYTASTEQASTTTTTTT